MSHSDNSHLILTTCSCSSYTNDVLALVNWEEEAWRQEKAVNPPAGYGGRLTSHEMPQLTPWGTFYSLIRGNALSCEFTKLDTVLEKKQSLSGPLFQMNWLCFYDGKKNPDTSITNTNNFLKGTNRHTVETQLSIYSKWHFPLFLGHNNNIYSDSVCKEDNSITSKCNKYLNVFTFTHTHTIDKANRKKKSYFSWKAIIYIEASECI